MHLLGATIVLIGCVDAFHLRMSAFKVSKVQMSSFDGKAFRVGAIATLASGFLQSTTPAIAANYGGFGSSYSEVVLPKDAVIDSELAGGEDFKKGLEGLTKTMDTIKTIREDFKANSQMNVGAKLSELNLSEIRISLNKYSAAFTEETQKGSDRLIRQVIQGITELSRETQVKEGKSRSSAKTSAVERRLAAVYDALDSLAQYYSK